VNELRLSYTGLDILQALEQATNYNAFLTDLVIRGAGGRQPVLDFGAGIGTFSKLLRDKGVSVTCVEADPSFAQALARAGFLAFRDLHEVPDDSFEFIFALNVLEHIEDDRAAVKLLGAKLKKRGSLLLYVPAFEFLWTALDDKIKHQRRYDKAGLKKLMRAAGLTVSECRYADSLGLFAALAFKMFGDKNRDVKPSTIAFYDRYVVPLSIPLDSLLGGLFGKNVYVVAKKD
jgi:2-polyprenyl-3-methyl-5-hydroxy-6-metoxy-1,4-benzoquinol methylase